MRRLLAFIAVAGCAAGLSGCTVASPGPSGTSMPSFYRSLAQPDAEVDAATAAAMIGAYRRNNGVAPVALDPELQSIAQAEASAMAKSDRPASAEAVKGRLAEAGFARPGANLSAGYHTLAEAFSGWRDSPQHNRILLDPGARRMGIATAFAPASKYKVYWALVTAAER
jgi:uncharacterized protein YkwD